MVGRGAEQGLTVLTPGVRMLARCTLPPGVQMEVQVAQAHLQSMDTSPDGSGGASHRRGIFVRQSAWRVQGCTNDSTKALGRTAAPLSLWPSPPGRPSARSQ